MQILQQLGLDLARGCGLRGLFGVDFVLSEGVPWPVEINPRYTASVEVLEYADPHAPYGLRGIGEPPTISSGPAVAAAIRAATGLDLRRVPIRPEHITGT